MSKHSDPNELTPAAAGSLLEAARKDLFGKVRDGLAGELKRQTIDLPIARASVPGVATVYARYKLPSLQQINLLTGQLGEQDRPNPYAFLTANLKLLVNLCIGVFAVKDEDLDTEISADLDVPDERVSDPETYPRFNTAEGVAAIVKTFGLDQAKITTGVDLVKTLYSEGQVLSTVNKLAQEAGFEPQGN